MDRLFKYFTVEAGDSQARAYMLWFTQTLPISEFSGTDALLYCYLEACCKYNMPCSRQGLQKYLTIEGKQKIKQYNIKEPTLDASNYNEASQLDVAYTSLVASTMETYSQYIAVQDPTSSFALDALAYFNDARAEKTSEAVMKAYPNIAERMNVTDTINGLNEKMREISALYDDEKIKEVADFTENDGADSRVKICEWGIPAVDGDCGGIYTHTLTTINAQPGGGKTRFSLATAAYRTLTLAKKDVLAFELELTEEQVRNILISFHISVMFKGTIKIPDSIMNRMDELSPDQRRVYEAAKFDLFESGKYGHLSIVKDCVIEHLEDRIMLEKAKYPNLMLILIDYMALLESQPSDGHRRSLEEYEIITMGYKVIRKILRSNNLAAICINQFNEKGIEAAFASKPIRSSHIQGGQIAYRHTDYDMSITYTEEQKISKQRTLWNGKTRGSAGFDSCSLKVELETSRFRQIE